MSIFPRRTVAGRTVTIHLRLASPRFGIADITVAVTDPEGRCTVVRRDRAWSFPLPEAERPPAGAAGPYRAPPTLLSLGALGATPTATRADELQRLDREMGRSIHFYSPYVLGPEAPPGRYEVAVEIFAHGRRIRSATEASEHFFVDRLRLRGVEETATGRVASLENGSPLPTPVRIVEVPAVAPVRGEHRSELVTLAGSGVTAVPIRQPLALAFYAEDTEWIRLSPGGGPLCAQNQAVAAGAGEVGGRDPSALTGSWKEIWDAAATFAPRALVRPGREEAYDAMREAGLIDELPVASAGN